MRRVADRGMSRLARLLIHVFFRNIELQNEENVPSTGPVVVVANHINGLVDALLLMATLDRYPRFLGKSTLFRIIPLWPFLKFAGVIPVYRKVDGVPGNRNAAAFSTAYAILANAGVVAIFPEGVSHDESTLQPLKTGAARIVLEAGFEAGIAEVMVIAVGLTYDAKARFRSRALVRVGEPVSVSSWSEEYQMDAQQAVREFTKDVERNLAEVSPTYSSWSQAERVNRVAKVVVRLQDSRLPSEVALADQVGVAERLAQAEQRNTVDDRLEGLLAAFTVYERDLELLGLSDAQVATEYPRSRLRWSIAWSLLRVVFALPFAIIGVIVHVVPFQIVKVLARRPSNEGMRATVKLLSCFASFTVIYVALGVVVGRRYGPWAGFAVAAASPLCGYVAVRLGERVKRIGGLLEGYRTVRGRQGVLSSVIAHREMVVAAAIAVMESP